MRHSQELIDQTVALYEAAKTYKEIADTLDLNENSVASIIYRYRVKRKLKRPLNTELSRRARREPASSNRPITLPPVPPPRKLP